MRSFTQARAWRILVIDDHEDPRNSMCHALRLCGHRCRGASSSGAALGALLSFAPEAIVLDWALELGRGRQLAKLLRAHSTASKRPLPIFIVSDGELPDAAPTLAGIDGYFAKPVSMVRIAEALAEIDRASKRNQL